jgi:flavodoxin
MKEDEDKYFKIYITPLVLFLLSFAVVVSIAFFDITKNEIDSKKFCEELNQVKKNIVENRVTCCDIVKIKNTSFTTLTNCKFYYLYGD